MAATHLDGMEQEVLWIQEPPPAIVPTHNHQHCTPPLVSKARGDIGDAHLLNSRQVAHLDGTQTVAAPPLLKRAPS